MVVKIAALGISLLILGLLVVYADPGRVAEVVAGSDHALIVAALLASTINIFLRAAKWNVLLDRVNFRDVLPAQIIGITISNFSPGKVAEPVKAVILKLRTGRPVSSTLFSIIWERVIDVVVLITLSVIGIVYFTALSGEFFLFSAAGLGVFLLLVFLALAFIYNKRFRIILFSFVRKLPVLSAIPDSFLDAFGSERVKKRALLYCLVLTSAVWLIDSAAVYLSVRAVGIEIAPAFVASVLALATIIGVITALPGGVGSTDVIMVLMLGAAGAGHSVAIAGVLLARFLTLWYFNLVGGVTLVYLAKKSRLDYKSVLS